MPDTHPKKLPLGDERREYYFKKNIKVDTKRKRMLPHGDEEALYFYYVNTGKIIEGGGGAGFNADEFIKLYDVSSSVHASKTAEGKIKLNYVAPGGEYAKDQLGLVNDMDYSLPGWEDMEEVAGQYPSNKRYKIFDSGADGKPIGTRIFWPIHLLKGRSVGWGVDKANDALIAPPNWKYHDNAKGMYGLGCYIKLASEFPAGCPKITYVKRSAYKLLTGGDWIPLDTNSLEAGYTSEAAGDTGRSLDIGSTIACGKTLGFPAGALIGMYIEFTSVVPANVKLYVYDYGHPQYNRLRFDERGRCDYIATEIGQDF